MRRYNLIQILRSIVSWLLWGYIIVHIFIIDLDILLSELLPKNVAVMIKYKLIGFMAIFFAYWYLVGHRQFLISIPYVIAFPIVLVFWKIPVTLLKLLGKKPFLNKFTWEYIIFSSLRFLANVKYIRVYLLSLFSLLVGTFFVAVSDEKYTNIAAIPLILLYLIVHFSLKIRGVFKHTLPLLDRIDKIPKGFFAQQQRKEIVRLKESLQNKQTKQKKNPEEQLQEKLKQTLITINLFCKLRHMVKDFAQSPRLVAYFLLSLGYTIFVTILSFAVIYTAIETSFNGSFTGVDNITFGKFLYYSLGTIFPVNMGDFTASSSLAMFFTGIEALLGWLILVILFYISTSLILKRYDQGMQKFVLLIDDEVSAVRDMAIYEYNIPQDSFDKKLKETGLGTKKE